MKTLPPLTNEDTRIRTLTKTATKSPDEAKSPTRRFFDIRADFLLTFAVFCDILYNSSITVTENNNMIQTLREFNIISVLFRLLLAMLAGGILGFGRGRKKQAAGLRTYLITCVGAALATLVGFYINAMLGGNWAEMVQISSIKFDGSRYSAAVISGIGFLAAGSIMLIAHQQISGLTTAIGLFITACIGIASGAGFYEAVILSVVFIVVVMELMYPLEISFKRRMRNMTIHVDFEEIGNKDVITDAIRSEGATIYDFEFEKDSKKKTTPSAIIWIRLSRDNPSHSAVLSTVAELNCVNSVQELIS